jgi:hypothetical protein
MTLFKNPAESHCYTFTYLGGFRSKSYWIVFLQHPYGSISRGGFTNFLNRLNHYCCLNLSKGFGGCISGCISDCFRASKTARLAPEDAVLRVSIFGFLFAPRTGQLRTINPRQVRKAMDKKWCAILRRSYASFFFKDNSRYGNECILVFGLCRTIVTTPIDLAFLYWV